MDLLINCEKCEKVFDTLQKLKTHTLTSKNCIGKKEKINIVCDYCNKKIKSNQMLNYHLGICTTKKIKLKELEYQSIIDNLELELKTIKEDYAEKAAVRQNSIESLTSLYDKLEPLKDHVNILLKIACST
jgi:hypothetical protein